MTVLAWFAVIVSPLIAVPLAPVELQQTPTEDSSELLVLEEALLRALSEKDAARLDELLASDYVLRGNPDVERSIWIDNALSRCWGDRFLLTGESVMHVGDTALVSFVLTLYRDPSTCEAATLRSLVTDVWVRRGGSWQLLLRASGPVGDGSLEAQFETIEGPPPAFEARGEFSFVATGGNASTETIGMAGDATHRLGGGTTTARVRFVTSEAEGVERARSIAAQARHGRRVAERLDIFGRAGYLRDRFAGLGHRVEADAGLTVTVAGLPHEATVGGGLGAVSETRLQAPDKRFATGTASATYQWTFNRTTNLKAETALVAELRQASNWRLASEVSLLTSLGRFLSARFSYAVRYANVPVPGFRRSDRTVAAALVFAYATPSRPPRF